MGKEKEKDGSNIRGLLTDLAEDGSEDGTRTATLKDTGTAPPVPSQRHASTSPQGPTKKVTSIIMPGPTEKAARLIPPALSLKGAATTLLARTWRVAGTAPGEPINSKQKGTPQPNRPPTPSSHIGCSDDNDSEDEEYVCCFLDLLGLDPVCSRMLHDKMKTLVFHERYMVNNAVPLIPQAVNENPKLFIEARAHITAARYTILKAIVRFDTWPGNILYFTNSQRT
jgi:hypothetical protein